MRQAADPSLRLAERGGRVLLHCFAGCECRAIVAALGFEASAAQLPLEPHRAGRGWMARCPAHDDLALVSPAT